MYRQQWEGLSVRVILLPASEAAPATPKPKTLLERLRTIEKIHAAPDLSENHATYLESHSTEPAENFIREDVKWELYGKH